MKPIKTTSTQKQLSIITKKELEAVRVFHENLIKPRMDKIFRKLDQGAELEKGSFTCKGIPIERQDVEGVRPFWDAYCVCMSHYFPPYPRRKTRSLRKEESPANRTEDNDA